MASRLTDRDRQLCRLLLEHRVFTTHQIAALAFDSINAAQHRLLSLYRLRILDRFRVLRTVGSSPYHWVLDELGAAVVAAERGVDVRDLGYRRDKALGMAHNQRLGHLVGVNGFFVSLAAAARRSLGCALIEWWPERRCVATWGRFVRPDGFGRWREGGREVDFFMEYDRGTETLGRVVSKLEGYTELASVTGLATPVLFWLPGPRREAELRRGLAGCQVPVWTAHAQPGASASSALWLSLGGSARVPLVELG